MHDLIHDLALSLAQNEYRDMSMGGQNQDIYRRIKQVSFSEENGCMVGEEVPKSFMQNDSSVRGVMPTVWSMCFDGKGGGDRIGELVKTCISKLKHLRMLDLSDTVDLEELPNSIGTLKHLRSLDLSGCRRPKMLPISITKLYNLQSLSLERCEELYELPKDIGDLINLKQLAITIKGKRLSAATENGIKSLSSLQMLSFDECENLEYLFVSEKDYDEAYQLTSLQMLTVSECKSLKFLFRPSTSAPRKRSCLTSLETLVFSGCPNLDLASTYNDEISFPRLISLMVNELPKMESLPQWVCPSTLETMFIIECPNLTSLPECLGNLTSLRQLYIGDCPKLLCLPEGIQCLAALTELKIVRCPDLSRRCRKGKGEDWPKIAHIPNLDVDSASENEDESEEEDDQHEIAADSSSFCTGSTISTINTSYCHSGMN